MYFTIGTLQSKKDIIRENSVNSCNSIDNIEDSDILFEKKHGNKELQKLQEKLMTYITKVGSK